jgi:hypothetical protein
MRKPQTHERNTEQYLNLCLLTTLLVEPEPQLHDELHGQGTLATRLDRSAPTPTSNHVAAHAFTSPLEGTAVCVRTCSGAAAICRAS